MVCYYRDKYKPHSLVNELSFAYHDLHASVVHGSLCFAFCLSDLTEATPDTHLCLPGINIHCAPM